MEYYSAIKMKNAIYSNIDGPRDYYTKWSHRERENTIDITHMWNSKYGTAAAAKSLQSCPTLCDPIDGSSPGSLVPGTLQARTLE